MFEQIIALIAPHACLHCGQEGALLCKAAINALPPPSQRCLICGSNTGLLCVQCSKSQPLDFINAATTYQGSAKLLVAKLKFERAKAAAQPIAQSLRCVMPNDTNLEIIHIPTASQRVRLRGYDQAVLVAKQLSRLSGLPYSPLLRRRGQQRQLGQSKQVRELQLREAFYVSRPSACQSRSFLLIDDVVTTGSTLQAAARVLKSAGASHVGALVFAAA